MNNYDRGEELYSGTAARKLEYDVYVENKVLECEEKQRNNNKVKRKAIFCVLVIFALGCLAMYRNAQITGSELYSRQLHRLQ